MKSKHFFLHVVYIVSTGSILDEKPRLARFDQLSKVSVSELMTTSKASLEEPEEDLGFFFDSEPAPNTIVPSTLPVLKQTNYEQKKQTNYEQKKQKVLQDDSVYIETDDDLASISSSEDISMLDALSHWAGNDILQFEEDPVKPLDHEDFYDYAMLEDIELDDIREENNHPEFGWSLEEDEEDSILSETGLSFDLLENVPDSLKNSYKSMTIREKKRVKKQAKKQFDLKERSQIRSSQHGKNNNLLDQ